MQITHHRAIALQINQLHPLVSVLTIAVMAVLAGATGPTSIVRWTEHKQDWLATLLDLPHGLPGKDVYRRVLSSLSPAAFQAWLLRFLDQKLDDAHTGPLLLSIDGKTLRRSHDRANDLGALHCVSVWAGQFGLTLAQAACDDKSNEPPFEQAVIDTARRFPRCSSLCHSREPL